MMNKKITNPQDIYEAIREHFKQHFNDATVSEMEAFNGIPKKLNKPFTQDEIRSSIKTLSNNRAPGFDNITCELIKYGTEELAAITSHILNNIFEKHNTEVEIGRGVLIALLKPKKSKGPLKNLRPITHHNA